MHINVEPVFVYNKMESSITFIPHSQYSRPPLIQPLSPKDTALMSDFRY